MILLLSGLITLLEFPYEQEIQWTPEMQERGETGELKVEVIVLLPQKKLLSLG